MESEILNWLRTLALIVFVASLAPCVLAQPSTAELLPLFPARVGSFERIGSPKPPPVAGSNYFGSVDPTTLEGSAEYSSGKDRVRVDILRFHQDAQAYSAVTLLAANIRSRKSGVELNSDFGTAGFSESNEVDFFKGAQLVVVLDPNNKSASVRDFARAFSQILDKGEGEIPPLVKHLPNWEENQKRAIFLNRFSSVQQIVPNQSVLSVFDTGGDADAVFADTGSGKVLVVEYHTPQLAKDNDERIIAKIHELWNLGQPAPIGYRRVGNYSVFVFDAPDEATAKQLIDQVKYEQVVQWLGDNPNILKEAERRYVETTLGVFIAVLKASGFALVACLGLGGLIGALLFSRRRSRQTALEAYSDAGGMLRLNIDEMTPQTDPARLLGPGH